MLLFLLPETYVRLLFLLIFLVFIELFWLRGPGLVTSCIFNLKEPSEELLDLNPDGV